MSNQLADKVDDLASSIEELEDVLKPLLEIPLSTLTEQLPALDRAKLQVWLSYVLNDLVWIYLRSRGINPTNTESGETHDVVAELDRVKSYFAKIKEAEDPAKRSLVVDGQVANRFIKHALSSAISAANFDASSASKPTHTRFDEEGKPTDPRPAPKSPKQVEPEPVVVISSDSDEEPEAGTWKAKKQTREADLARQRGSSQQEAESDDSLEGLEEANLTPVPVVEEERVQSEVLDRTKRPRMDPFAGYDQSVSNIAKRVATTNDTPASSSAPFPKPAAILRQEAEESDVPSPASSSVPSSTANPKRRRGKKGGSRHKKQHKTSQHDSNEG